MTKTALKEAHTEATAPADGGVVINIKTGEELQTAAPEDPKPTQFEIALRMTQNTSSQFAHVTKIPVAIQPIHLLPTQKEQAMQQQTGGILQMTDEERTALREKQILAQKRQLVIALQK